MNSLILRTAVRLLIALLLVFSIFILLRGHDEPGGGFIGGLIAAGAVALYGVAFGSAAARELLVISPRLLIGVGLVLGAGSGLFALLARQPFLTGQWWTIEIGEFSTYLSSVLIFDFGVFAVVVGFVLAFVLYLEEVTDDAWPEPPAGPAPEERTPPAGPDA